MWRRYTRDELVKFHRGLDEGLEAPTELVPHGLRYRMAHDPSLTTAVLGVLVRAVTGWLKRRARRLRVAGPLKTGAVTVIQRFELRAGAQRPLSLDRAGRCLRPGSPGSA
jgi:hypothetical protein